LNKMRFVEDLKKEEKMYLYKLEELGLVSVKRYLTWKGFAARWILTDKGTNLIEDDPELNELWLKKKFKGLLDKVEP